MTCTADAGSRDELRGVAEKITDLTMLIQEFPGEARLILEAVEDGLTLGPAQVMDDARCFDDGEEIEEAASSPGIAGLGCPNGSRCGWRSR
jgi:hypothetical protein